MSGGLDELFVRYRRTGDPDALAELFDRAAPRLLRVAEQLSRDPLAADDLLQATFVTAIEKADRYDAARPVLPWLLGILANLARRAAPAPIRPERLHARPPGDPVDHAATRELSDEVWNAIEEMPAPYREVLLLRLRHELEPGEIAELLRRAPGTVRSQLHRGLEMLRRALPVGIALPLALLVPARGGLAAVREAVLAKAAVGTATVPAAAVAGGVVMKKKIFAAAIVLALLSTAWLARDRGGGAGEEGPEKRAATDRATPPADAERKTTDETAFEPTLSKPVSRTGEVFVRVVWADTGKPAPDLGVRVLPWDASNPFLEDQRATTGPDGTLRFSNVPSGRVFIMFDSGLELGVRLEGGGRVSQTVRLERGIAVDGAVVDDKGRPVDDARIWMSHVNSWSTGSFVARTDSEGRFRIASARRGQHVGAYSPRYARSRHVGIRGSRIKLELRAPGGVAEGIVLDEHGRPVAGARVWFGERELANLVKARADAQGRVRVEGLYPRRQKVRARARGFTLWEGVVDGRGPRPGHFEARLTPGATVYGTVRDGQGEAMQGALVHVPEGFSMVTTSSQVEATMTRAREDGSYRLEGIRPGAVTVKVSSSGGWASRSFDLTEGESVRWDAVVSQGQRIHGRLVDGAGRPLAGWWISAGIPGKTEHARRITNEEGEFVFAGCAELEHSLWVWQTSDQVHGYLLPGKFTPSDEARTIVVADAARARGRLGGTVLDPDGRPLEGAKVIVRGTNLTARTVQALTDKSGVFGIDSLVPGPYRVTMRAKDLPDLDLGAAEIEPDLTRDLGLVRWPRPAVVQVVVEAPTGATVYGRLTGRAYSPIPFENGVGTSSRPLPAGKYKLHVRGEGVADHEEQLELSWGDRPRIRVALRAGVYCQLRFTVPEGVPTEEHLALDVGAPGGFTRTAKVRATVDGDYVFGLRLAPAAYTVEARVGELRATGSFTIASLARPPEPIPFALHK